MNSSQKPLGPVTLGKNFDSLEQARPLEILAASLIAERMLWPEPKEERNRSLYFTLCLRKVQSVLLEDLGQNMGQIAFLPIVRKYFGGIEQYTENLALVNFPPLGKGSLAERAWQGTLAGSVFQYAFQHEVSLNAAAEEISKRMHAELQGEEFANISKPSPDNIMKNYWPRFQTVAHFWAAMDFFEMPEIEDGIIRLDRAMPRSEAPQYRSGWRGVRDAAHDFLEKSAEVKRYKTHKTLLDQETAFRVIFSE